jgi:hypothetical protein
MAFEFSNARLPADISVGNIGSKVVGEFPINISLSAATDAVTRIIFVAPFACNVLSVNSRFGVASTSGTYMLEKLPSGTATGAGTNLFASAAALSGTADTNLSTALTGNTQMKAGDALNLIFAGTMTGLTKAGITVVIQRQ